MKPGWTTRAIGRHLVDLPANAELYETYTVNQDKLELLPIKTRADFDGIVFTREQQLKKTLHQERKESMFIERVNLPNGSVILISWKPYRKRLAIMSLSLTRRTARLLRIIYTFIGDGFQRVVM